MGANQIIRSALILLICGSLTKAYKRDHGFGYLFKHDPNMQQRELTERLTTDRIRTALGGGIGNGAIFPEVLSIADLQTKYSGTTMYFGGMRIYGLDRFRPLQINSDFTNLAVFVTLLIGEVNVLGSFRMTPWVGGSPGTFNFTIADAWLSFSTDLVISNEGTTAEGFSMGDQSETNLSYESINLNFDGIGILSTILKPVKGSLSKYIFSQLKPTLCAEAEQKFKQLVNKVLQELPKDSTSAVNVVDRALVRARQTMKTSQLDPLYITDHYPKSTKLVRLELTQGKLHGLSTMKRIGPILFGYERDAVHMMLNFGVENLQGQYTWTWTFWKDLLTNRGLIRFNVKDITIKMRLEKRLKAEDNPTRVQNVTMHIGSVNLVSDGTGTVKYIMETFLNVVPDTFRQRIMESAEYRLLTVIENEVGKIDLEELTEDDGSNSVETGA